MSEGSGSADLQNGWYRPPHIHFMISATGKPQFVTQMYFRGEALLDNDWIQQLNRRDFLLQHQELSAEQKEQLIVDFEPKDARQELVGRFDIKLK